MKKADPALIDGKPFRHPWLANGTGNRTRLHVGKQKVPQKLIPWLEAKKRHRLTDAHVQMARELGMNPKKLGKLDNHKYEPWKLPLPQFIEKLYLKSFKRPRPEKIVRLG